MLDGVGIIVRVEVRLREVEAGQIVVGESLPQLARPGDSVVTHGVVVRFCAFICKKFARLRRLTESAYNSGLQRLMQSKFYQAGEHRAEKVHELFAMIARRYDLLNDIMSAGLHRRWKRRLVELADGKR